MKQLIRRKIVLWFFILALLALACAACTSGSEPYAATQPNRPPASKVVTVPTARPSPTRPPGCTVVTQKTPNPTVESLLPAPTAQDHARGPKDAMVTIIEYSDFMCPSCASLVPILTQLEKKYPADLRVIFRHFPLSNHDKAQLAARASEAAALQDKFWEMHDLLFEQSQKWVDLKPEEFQTWVVDQAAGLGLDKERFVKDMNSEAVVKLAQDAWE